MRARLWQIAQDIAVSIQLLIANGPGVIKRATPVPLDGSAVGSPQPCLPRMGRADCRYIPRLRTMVIGDIYPSVGVPLLDLMSVGCLLHPALASSRSAWQMPWGGTISPIRSETPSHSRINRSPASSPCPI